MASAIETTLISAILQPMAAKAMDIIKDKGKAIAMVVDKVDGILNIERDISNLQTTLCIIEGIVPLAEEKQIDNVYIRKWLRELIDIGYEARDVLEDFFTFSSCVITAEEVSNPVNFISSFMLSYFGGSSSDTSNIPLAILNRLEKDIRSVRERFDEKKKESEIFPTLRSAVGEGSESVCVDRRPEVGPYLNQQADNLLLGREEVKQGIMEKILHPSDDKRVQVVAIWGMGGIGKTTLAKSIYNDERVKEDYYPTKNRRWLCVGENKLSAKEIITKIIGDSSTNDVESLQEKLVEKFKDNRFLVVLDDVWDVDDSEWKILSAPLTIIGKGGVIILTTRRSKVITATNTLVPDALRPLSPQDSWSIFESCAFIDGNADSRPDLKRIGKKIVEKLKGLPLALEVVGRSLLIEKDTHTWRSFLDFNEWKLRNNDDDIMPALKWSYNRLPLNLKQCFAYCALFPKDHVYDEKALVKMWMAHDLISNIVGGGQRRLEDIGAQYFKELVYASLIQLVDDEYVMHDMTHDLALLVSNEEFLLVSNEESASANSSLRIDIMEKVRHITITHDYSKILRLCKSEKLLTLYTICSGEEDANLFDDDIFKQLKSIRVLVLCGKGIKEIPDFISKLKHLRYLDVSQTSVKSLPDSLCDLYHLRTLAAPLDAILPRNIVNMVNMRHLRANITTYEGIAKLTSLQELSSISVCEDGCISELGYLRELHGKLEIHGLENVTDPEDAAKALMQDKKHIDELRLVYDVNLGNTAIATNVLDTLQCPPNLTSLTIDGYSGNKCPNWMTSGKLAVNLQRLGLHKCHKLKLLPPLGELNSLKHLFLESMNGIERLGVELYGKGINGKVFFPSLISIHLDDMKNWKEWDSDIFEDTSVSFFPCLRNLLISKCPKLVSILPPLNAANVMRSLYNLDITGCHGLELFKLDGLISLKYLVIKKCSNLACITPSLQVASTIKDISISICKKLKRIECESLPSLTDLSIIRCDEIVSIPHLVRIERLDLNDCGKLRSLTIGRQGLISLTDLNIEGCPLLTSIYEEGSTSCSSSSALPLSNLQHLITDSILIFTKLFNHELVIDNDVLLRVFEQLKSIRVLVLSHKNITEIPGCIGELKHLRYLDISQTSVESLPDSLCVLHNLQTLAAPLDAILPRNIVNMVNLRHLRANITTYEGIAKLTSLQELSSVSVCEDGCISELGYLRELHGKLEIHGLENVTDPEDAAKALMQDKIHIDELRLVYDVNLGNTAIATNVLDALQCPPNLTYLRIDGYSGNKCPNWMTSGELAVNLQRLRLHKCHKLKLLPPLGELNSLKHLYLKSMNGIERLGVELYGKGINGKVFFPSLISIHLYDMKNWKEWDSDIFEDTSVSFFPCLRNLLISKCPKLVSILPPLNAANVMRSLYNLDITGCHGLQLFKLDGLISLKHLDIKKCSNLACITPSLQVASTIEDISISNCEKLNRIECESLPSLTDLSIKRCDEIVSIPHLVRIERLDLNDCGKLRSLNIGRQGLISLTDLNIEGCPLLTLIYEEGSTSSSSSSTLPLS